MTDVLEKGDVWFLVWPAQGEREVAGLPDVQRFFLVLRPEGSDRVRRLVVGHKKLPEQEGRDRYWGFVDKVLEDAAPEEAFARDADDLRGPPPQPAGRGTYALARHGDHVDLAYRLEEGGEAARAREALHVHDEAAYVVSVKNPKAGSPEGAGLDPGRRADLPAELRERFGDHRWLALDPPAFLDHEGTEFLLIASDERADEAGLGTGA